MADPRALYSQHLEERQSRIAVLEGQHRLMGYLKLGTALAGALVVWLALFELALSIAWTLAPIALFAALVVRHDRMLAVLERRRRAVRYFERSLARLDGRWAGTGDTGADFLETSHPYAVDLDLFGKGSLFELLSTARTHVGRSALAGWLLTPASPETVRARQQAVEELRPRVDLREDLAVAAGESGSAKEAASLAKWGEAPPLAARRSLRIWLWVHTALGALAAVAGIALALDSAGVAKLSPAAGFVARDGFLLLLAANGWFLYRTRNTIGDVVSAVEEAAHELALLSEVLVRLERERFTTPLLVHLRESLDSAGEPPSRRMARLNRIVERLDSREHLLVRMLEPILLWTAHAALAAEDWRAHSGTAVRRWLEATGEMESLCSLANHAFEHPADVFPEVEAGAACLEASAVGHPLIPEDRVVRNDVRIGGALRVLVVSGSNMSGKSTLLRTLGANIVLAQAGGTVRAAGLRLSPLAIGASIRLTDSLQDGISRFYAEILRIRQILDLTAGERPVLFLVDEFLHGTNSHDRRIGAEALVKGLVDRGAIGLVTTHDLALAKMVETLGERAANVHFEDRLEDGRIRFDYVMHPGVVRKSNAIELMRQVGLEI